jgi:tetratricopeptide (TPR) repeat protein
MESGVVVIVADVGPGEGRAPRSGNEALWCGVSRLISFFSFRRPVRRICRSTSAACLGAADRSLGMLAAVIQDWEKAEEHFDAALALENKIESPPLLARTQTWYARMLIARGSSGDHERARELLGSALSTAESLGMAGLVAECQAMLDR